MKLFTALALCTPVLGQQFTFEVNPATSSAALTSSFAVDLPGSLIGAYDAAANPGGTRTLPGLFGGSGNEPISSTFGFLGDSNLLGNPAGSFGLYLDLRAGEVGISGLEVDLLGGEEGATDLTLRLEYQTFRTFAPDSIFIGDFPLEIPIGSQVLRDIRIEQVGRSEAGSVQGDLGRYSISALVPVELSFLLVVEGAETPVGPLPLVLPLSGQLDLSGSSAVASFALDLEDSQVIEDPLPDFELADVPFDLPTILPPGATANLLLSAVISSLGVDTDLSLSLVAQEEAPCGFEAYCPGNANSTGLAATLAAVGSPVVEAGDLAFVGQSLPPLQFAYLMMAREQDAVPFFRGSQGTLCLQMPVLKFTPHVVGVDSAGAVEVPVDFERLPPGVELLAGESWNFQLWYRDLNPGVTTNTSNGVQVQFCR